MVVEKSDYASPSESFESQAADSLSSSSSGDSKEEWREENEGSDEGMNITGDSNATGLKEWCEWETGPRCVH